MRTRAMSAGREWKIFDTWFRARLENELELEEIEAEKISRFILSLFLNQDDVDYQRERDMFKYSKISPNGKPKMVSEDYTDSKSATEMAIDEIFSISPLDGPEVTDLVIEIITQLKSKIETGNHGQRKRKISEAQSTTSTRSSSSSSSTYEDEFPPIKGSINPSPLLKESCWVTSRPSSRGIVPIEKETEPEVTETNRKYRFAFKNPTGSKQSRNKRNKPRKTKTSAAAQSNETNHVTQQNQNQSQDKPTQSRDQGHRSSGKSTPTSIKDKKGKKSEKTKPEANRKRKRPRKKKNSKKITDDKGESPLAVSKYENLDNFSSLEDALKFLKNCSAASEPADAQIWEKVIQDQHVKYVNGSFFFTPRLKQLEEGPPCNTEVELNPVRPVKDVSRGSDPFLDQAAMTAYGAVLKIIDEEFISTGGESTTLVLDETVTDFKEVQRDSKMKSFHFRSFPVNNIWSDTVSRDWNF
jgi:hypothetical protein